MGLTIPYSKGYFAILWIRYGKELFSGACHGWNERMEGPYGHILNQKDTLFTCRNFDTSASIVDFVCREMQSGDHRSKGEQKLVTFEIHEIDHPRTQ